MVDTIADSWPIWFSCIFFGIALLKFISNNRSGEVHPGMATTSEDFSMQSTFFSIQSGEAVVFFTSLFTIGNFLLFSISMARMVIEALPG